MRSATPEEMMMSSLVLGIDTSTQVCVGLARDGEVVESVAVGDSRSHAELLMPAIAGLLKRAKVKASDLTAVAAGMGPGPFTGLRAGVAVAETLGYVEQIPVLHVCSLDVLGVAWAMTNPPGPYIACTDARRHELYWAVYDEFGRRWQGPFVSAPSDLPKFPCIGPGALLYPQAGSGLDSFLAIKLGVRVDSFASQWPRPEEVAPIVGINAGFLAAFGDQLPDVGPEPLYLRRADAGPLGPAKSVLTSRPAEAK